MAGGPGAGPGGGPGIGAGGGNPDALQRYLAEIRSWLERHKEYPMRARTRRQEGTALLRFAVDRNGRVSEWTIERSSGHGLLDRAVEEMVRRAQPFPAPPAGAAIPETVEVMLPVEFALR